MKNVWQSGESTGALDEKKRLSNICSRFSSIKERIGSDTAKRQVCSSHCPEPGTSQKLITYDTRTSEAQAFVTAIGWSLEEKVMLHCGPHASE